MSNWFFLTVEDVRLFHAEQLARHGGLEGVRNQAGLESAVAMPQASFGGQLLHSTIWEMAAAYIFHLAENQPFLDGNKRTALVAGLTFLELNGVHVREKDSKLYEAMIALSERKMDKPKLAALLQQLARATGRIQTD